MTMQTVDLKRYVLFEGIDGAGKSSLVDDVGTFLFKALGQNPLVTREPGSTMNPVTGALRSILKSGEKICPAAEVFLFMADRAQHTEMVVRPALTAGRIVLQDRGFLSTYAYQGYGRSWDLAELLRFNSMTAHRPDLIVMVRTDPEVAWGRIKGRAKDQFEARAFQMRVHDGFSQAMRDATPDVWRNREQPSAFPWWDVPPILVVDGAADRTANVHRVTDHILDVSHETI